MYYLTETDPRGPWARRQGEDGLDRWRLSDGDRLQDGKVVWRISIRAPCNLGTHSNYGRKLLFAGDLVEPVRTIRRMERFSGIHIWPGVQRSGDLHAGRHQYLLMAGGDSLYAFTLY